MSLPVVQTTGAEFNRFRQDEFLWRNAEYMDDAEVFVNGRNVGFSLHLADNEDRVTIVGGHVHRLFGTLALYDLFEMWKTLTPNS